MDDKEDIVETITAAFKSLEAADRLRFALDAVPGRAVLTTSFGFEDQILTHMICRNDLSVDIVTLDTGRLFPETYDLWSQTEARYKRKIYPYFPDGKALKDLVSSQGINGFYDSVEARKACCHVRKVVPLNSALDGAALWITGLRRQQSERRQNAPFAEYDPALKVIKVAPVLDWSSKDMQQFKSENPSIPTNPLHEKGYPSIGCQPCTRAVEAGESERAGRWWWEKDNQECGLHVGPDGRLVRNSQT